MWRTDNSKRTRESRGGVCVSCGCVDGVRCLCRLNVWQRWKEIDWAQGNGLSWKWEPWVAWKLLWPGASNLYLMLPFFLVQKEGKGPWRAGVGGRKKGRARGSAGPGQLPSWPHHHFPLLLSAFSCSPGRGFWKEKAAFSGGVGDMTVTSGDFGLWFPRKQLISSLLYYSVIEALPKLSTK